MRGILRRHRHRSTSESWGLEWDEELRRRRRRQKLRWATPTPKSGSPRLGGGSHSKITGAFGAGFPFSPAPVELGNAFPGACGTKDHFPGACGENSRIHVSAAMGRHGDICTGKPEWAAHIDQKVASSQRNMYVYMALQLLAQGGACGAGFFTHCLCLLGAAHAAPHFLVSLGFPARSGACGAAFPPNPCRDALKTACRSRGGVGPEE
eukprot:gene17657-biopygen3875